MSESHQLSNLKMFILDVLRHDEVEQIRNILDMLNSQGCIGWREFWPSDFSAQEVEAALRELIKDGMIDPLDYDEDGRQQNLPVSVIHDIDSIGHLWFHLTDCGWREWEKWTPPQG